MYEIISFLGLGLLAGFLAGLLGIGGGIIIVPALLFLFKAFHIGLKNQMHLVIGTALASMIVTTLSSSFSQLKKRNIDFSILKPMGGGAFLGAVIGVFTTTLLPSTLLKILFGILECLIAFRFITKKNNITPKYNLKKLPPSFILSLFSIGISFLSTILGISGGVLIVPFLDYFRFPLKKAIGISSALSFIITLTGSIAFALMNKKAHIAERIGLIYVPAFVSISLAAIVSAPLGVKLNHVLPSEALKKILGYLLLGLGISMISCA